MPATQREPVFKVDKSALARSHLQPVAQQLEPLFPTALVATCPIIDLELLFSVRNHAEHTELRQELKAMPSFPIAQTTGQPTQWIAPRGTL